MYPILRREDFSDTTVRPGVFAGGDIITGGGKASLL